MSSINAVPDPQLGLLVSTGDNTSTLAFQTNSINSLVLDANQNANCTSTGAFRIPVGTTEQRPSSAVNGMVRYNITIPCLEGYANGAWVTIR